VTRAALWALAICVAAAALEGVLAGPGVKARLEQLRQPRYSPPFAVWVGIGVLYYSICFVVLSRLINSPPSPLRSAGLASVVALLIGNATWNLALFRYKNIEASVIVSVVYAVLALAVAVLLVLADPVSAWVFLPYLIYLSYATWWVLALRRLNRIVFDQTGTYGS
jgi:benzodiazapine receptor